MPSPFYNVKESMGKVWEEAATRLLRRRWCVAIYCAPAIVLRLDLCRLSARHRAYRVVRKPSRLSAFLSAPFTTPDESTNVCLRSEIHLGPEPFSAGPSCGHCATSRPSYRVFSLFSRVSQLVATLADPAHALSLGVDWHPCTQIVYERPGARKDTTSPDAAHTRSPHEVPL